MQHGGAAALHSYLVKGTSLIYTQYNPYLSIEPEIMHQAMEDVWFVVLAQNIKHGHGHAQVEVVMGEDCVFIRKNVQMDIILLPLYVVHQWPTWPSLIKKEHVSPDQILTFRHLTCTIHMFPEVRGCLLMLEEDF